MQRRKDCPDCGGPLRPVRAMGGTDTMGMQLELSYGPLGARRRWFDGAYPASGAIGAEACEQCGRLLFFLVPNDPARAVGLPIPAEAED